MNIWIVYDIESSVPGNRRRRKIIKEIEQFGLYRVQKSVFFGNIERNRFDELVLFSEELIDPEKDSVYLFPMCNEDFDSVKIIGQGFDKDMVSGKKDSLIF
ncbi:MAG: CRISPR-associated endonuclease Cas2 [Candidatus Aminicenantes bacterium]|nr:CRISPR-associated endonuclease Cas2 [Candidatus Aminicenantes bacterium]NIM77357.1 CRISPR-associated endonuclease Cas2 [Candidatus Aminicenantes bacterium]NIN16655.1 CRISPR-associated endonuclease Cas2 [Candidatus Aminicenantes bacterium]NIN40513.1 CRISPR-associated endonuclease Cas2 [Candidatus Aminicenantes bacterium]NIN83333.1 CRISPR-associated endonuclease Cas2 [Candidatus Aminicenantes bacterium]